MSNKLVAFEEWWGNGTEFDHDVGVVGIARTAWDAAQAVLRDATCPSCNHPMSVHDNRAEPVETHGCLVCAERARVRLEMEREQAEAVAAAYESVIQKFDDREPSDCAWAEQKVIVRHLTPTDARDALARALDNARAEAQQQMRDMGFQHPDDVAKMILSTAAREKAK